MLLLGLLAPLCGLWVDQALALAPQKAPKESNVWSRRQAMQTGIIASMTTAIVSQPTVAEAGEIGARINQAVTQSDLGISVRRAVVRGAQTMDAWDGQWEDFSDRFGLGQARKGQPFSKPAPKVIPPPQPLDATLASTLLALSDESFLQTTSTKKADLDKQVQLVRETVGPSFVRSGLNSVEEGTEGAMSAAQFNFLCYCHFKAYSDIIIQRGIDFRSFRPKFEALAGRQLVSLLNVGDVVDSSPNNGKQPNPKLLREQLDNALATVNRLSNVLVEKGLVAQVESSSPREDEDRLADWLDDIADLQWSVALDGDITQNSQILLQEQGYRLYPNFAKYAVRHILTTQVQGQSVDVTEYYMDTDYNSDPAKFDVKEILLNVVLEKSAS